MISRKKRKKYKEAARQLAASNNLSIDLNNWENIWNLLDKFNTKPASNVYIIGEAGGDKVKIGKSNNPGQRLKALQTSHPNKLYLYAFCLENNKFNEKQLHQQFSNVRLTGEWFQYTPELQQITKQIKQQGLSFS